MLDEIDKVYRLASLSQYSLKQRVSIRLADLAFFLLIKLIGSTVRFETRGEEHLDSIKAAGKIPIYTTWHDRIFLSAYYLRNSGIVFLTSQSFDGEYIARFIQRFGFGTIRGSSTRGGAKGLVEMIRGMGRGLAMGFTIDGPKGPRYETKAGAITLAKKTGNPVLPFVLQPRHFWTLNSWDRLQIPRPFTRGSMIYGTAIHVSESATDEEFELKRRELQASLDDLVRQGLEWAEKR